MKADDKTMEYQILEAAERLFLEQGYTKTTTGQIAKLAGCNQALVHYYYRTKDNLFDRVFEEKIRLIAANILAVDSSGTLFEDKIAKMAGMHFDFLKENPKLPPFIFSELVSNPERLRSLAGKLQQYPKSIFMQLEALLKQEIEKGAIRPISSVDLIFTILSLNVAPFLTMPVLQKAMGLSDADVREMLEHRKEEIIETILARLRK